MPVEPKDLENLQNAITQHTDDTVLPILKRVDEQQAEIKDLYEKNTKTQVALASIPGAIEVVDKKHDGKHEVIKSSAKTAYVTIGVVMGLITIALTILAIALSAG